MGDCGFSHISLNDKNTSNLREMLLDTFGNEQIKVLAMHGMGLRSQYYVFAAQLENGLKPEALVIMINFDTLTGKQHLLPRAQHAELLKSLYSSLKVKNKEFEEYLVIVQKRSQNAQVEFLSPKISRDTVTLNDMQIRNYFRLNYLYELDDNTEGVLFLKKIIKLAEENGIRILPFIPPINFELGKKFFKTDFDIKYQNNVKKIKGILDAYGIELLDFSYSLQSDMFAEQNTPDETVNEAGRVYLVRRFILALEGIYARQDFGNIK